MRAVLGWQETAGTKHMTPCLHINDPLAPERNSTMKKAIFAVAVAVTLTSSAAFAQSVGEKTGVNSMLGVAPKTEDFIKEAAMSDMLEIEAAKVAQQKGNADEKTFADHMIADHTKTSSELKGMVDGELKGSIPTALDDSSQKKLDKLKDAKPEDFAGEYDPMQVSAHKDAVSLFDRYAKGGDNSKLKDWAGKTLPALQHHLEMAQAMDKNRK
jgi:putative membrane protein